MRGGGATRHGARLPLLPTTACDAMLEALHCRRGTSIKLAPSICTMPFATTTCLRESLAGFSAARFCPATCRLQCCTLLSGHRHVCHTVLLLEQQSCNCKAQADRTKPTLSFVRVGFASPGCADPERTVFGANAFVRDSKGVALWSSAKANAAAVLVAKGTVLHFLGCCTDAQPGLTHSPFGTCFKDEPLAIALLVQPSIEHGSMQCLVQRLCAALDMTHPPTKHTFFFYLNMPTLLSTSYATPTFPES